MHRKAGTHYRHPGYMGRNAGDKSTDGIAEEDIRKALAAFHGEIERYLQNIPL